MIWRRKQANFFFFKVRFSIYRKISEEIIKNKWQMYWLPYFLNRKRENCQFSEEPTLVPGKYFLRFLYRMDWELVWSLAEVWYF